MDRSKPIETALDEALDALVSGDPAAARRVQERFPDAPELAELMSAAGQIRAAFQSDGPSAAAQERHLRLIRDAAGGAAQPAPVAVPPQPVGPERRRSRRAGPVRRFVLRPVLLVGLLLVLAAPGALALSARALPGDFLYPTKLAVEDVRLALTRDPAKEVDLHVQFAKRRVNELKALSGRGLPGGAALAPVLSDLKEHQSEAADTLEELKKGDGRSVAVLEERVAVTLQQSTMTLVELRNDSGCTEGDTDRRCRVITVAVDVTQETLRRVDESEVAATPSPQVPEPSAGTGPAPDQGVPAPAPSVPGQQGELQLPPPAIGVQPGTGEPSQPPSEGTVPQPAPVEPAPPRADQGAQSLPPPAVAPAPIQADIDIKPLDDTNTLDIEHRWQIPVVVHTTPELDATTLDTASICFGDDPTDPANSDCTVRRARFDDIDADGDQDLVLMFSADQSGIDLGDTEACLAARTADGRAVRGCDKLSVVEARSGGGGSDPAAPGAWAPPGHAKRIDLPVTGP